MHSLFLNESNQLFPSSLYCGETSCRYVPPALQKRWAQTPAWQRTVPSVLAERTKMVEEDSLSQLGECDSLTGLTVALQTENECSRWLSWERKGFCRELESDVLYVPHLCSRNCRKHLHALHHFVFHVRKLLSCSHVGMCMVNCRADVVL